MSRIKRHLSVEAEEEREDGEEKQVSRGWSERRWKSTSGRWTSVTCVCLSAC